MSLRLEIVETRELDPALRESDSIGVELSSKSVLLTSPLGGAGEAGPEITLLERTTNSDKDSEGQRG